MTATTVSFAARAVIAFVFALAAFGKAKNAAALADFQATLGPVRWLPAAVHRPVAVGVVGVEAIVALTVLWPPTAIVGLVLAIGSLAAFTAAATVAWRSGTRLQCRCFGSDAGEMGPSHLIRNGLLLVIAFAGLLPPFSAPDTAGAAIVAVLAGAVVAILFARWSDVVYLFARRT